MRRWAVITAWLGGFDLNNGDNNGGTTKPDSGNDEQQEEGMEKEKVSDFRFQSVEGWHRR